MLLRRDHTGPKTNCPQAPEKEAESALAGPKSWKPAKNCCFR
jgi:hypothetical protein